MKVVIVGGVAGGATAAARIRRLNETATSPTQTADSPIISAA